MKSRWNDQEASCHQGIEQLVYRSRLIGQEPSLVLWGGGNTSLKHQEKDFRGQEISVMRIKGSGSDLKSILPKDFPGIRLEDLRPLVAKQSMSDEDMVAYLAHCLMEPTSPRPSIETLLHGFLGFTHIDHTHADVILSLTNNPKGYQAFRELFGDRLGWIPYRRPGFALSKQVYDVVKNGRDLEGLVLEKHGLITWGNQSKESYLRTIQFITMAEDYLKAKHKGRKVFGSSIVPGLSTKERRAVAAAILPVIRGIVGKTKSVVLRFDDSADILAFVNSARGPALSQIGAATPDHMLSTKPKPLFVPQTKIKDVASLKNAIRHGLEQYKQDYTKYFERNKASGVKMLDPYPRVLLIAGVGMITTGKDMRAATIPAEIYHHTIAVIGNAVGIAPYESLSDKDTYDVDYWPMELYKLSLAPKQKEFSGKIAFVTGAASGIGRATSLALLAEGAHVVATDISKDGLAKLQIEMHAIAGGGRSLVLPLDVTKSEHIAAAFARTILEFGGLDIVVSNAGIAHVASIETLLEKDWERVFDVNSSSHFYVAKEAIRIIREQGLGGSIVFVASKNVLAPGKDFGAYSASKAAQTQLARIIAIENGQHGIRVNIVNPDAVFGNSGLWSEKVKNDRAKAHGIKPEQLQDFYVQRNLLKRPVTAEDVAQSILFLASERSSKTTGCILTVDGGVKEAFPR